MTLHDLFLTVSAARDPTVLALLYFSTKALGASLNYRRKRDIFRLHHTQRMAAIEKGVQIPPLPREFFQDDGAESPPQGRRSRYSQCNRSGG